jgi:hypothetical protein
MANHNCSCLKELLSIEIPELRREINLNKYYLSEKARQDVGWTTAEKDFIEHYLNTWAAGFKAAYCGYVCLDKDNCQLNKV